MLGLEQEQDLSRIVIVHELFYISATGTSLAAKTMVGGSAAISRFIGTRQTARIVIYCRVTFVDRKGTQPMDQGQVASLENKHASLEAMIDEEEHRPHPDDIKLHQLKKEKLRVKDVLTGH